MIHLTQDYKDIIHLFNHHRVRYLIAGSYAMAKLGYSRNTFDIDIWVEKTSDNATNIVSALEGFGVPFALTKEDFLIANTVIQIGTAPNRIDILTDIDGVIFDEAWSRKIETFYGELPVNILSINDIIQNRKASGRAKDLLDVIQLEALLFLVRPL